MSSKQKGWKSRRHCIDYLIKQGYLVDTVEKTNRFAKQKDMYGLFDLCALNNNEIKFVQVTTNKPHTHKNYEEFSLLYPAQWVSIEQWVYVPYKGFVIYKYKYGTKKSDNISQKVLRNTRQDNVSI